MRGQRSAITGLQRRRGAPRNRRLRLHESPGSPTNPGSDCGSASDPLAPSQLARQLPRGLCLRRRHRHHAPRSRLPAAPTAAITSPASPASSRSVFARRARRFTSILEESTTTLRMPGATTSDATRSHPGRLRNNSGSATSAGAQTRSCARHLPAPTRPGPRPAIVRSRGRCAGARRERQHPLGAPQFERQIQRRALQYTRRRAVLVMAPPAFVPGSTSAGSLLRRPDFFDRRPDRPTYIASDLLFLPGAASLPPRRKFNPRRPS